MSLQTIPPELRSATERPDARAPWLRHLGLVNDYVHIPYANGSSFASQFLYRSFRARGHQVTVIGPHDPAARAEELPERHAFLRSLPLRNHPGVRLPLPTPGALARIKALSCDLVLGQTSSAMTELGVWLRATARVPFLAVNTLHLGAAYDVLLPDVLARQPAVRALFERGVVPAIEAHSARVYNETDGLIVLSHGLSRFWRERGVTVPIHVIPRSVDPTIFDARGGDDPFDPRACRGQRLLVVCRHTREKSVDRLLRSFALHVLPHAPNATLTLVGDGPDHESLKRLAVELGIAGQTFFPGEFPVTDIARFYRHADLFLYASRSETYGQVVSEALWCGLPVVALADGMGVSDQVEHDVTGALIDQRAGQRDEEVDAALGAHVVALLRDPARRRTLAESAATRTRLRVHPGGVIARYYEAFEHARAHCARTTFAPGAGPKTLARWTAVQSAALGLGLLRKPAQLNRHGRHQPGWDAPRGAARVESAASTSSTPRIPRSTV